MEEAGPSSRPLDLDEYKRYGRQMIMPGWGLPGQIKLKNARVTVVGAGGLGCPLLQHLAGAGIGHLTIIDHDTVDLSNLHRQILHATDMIGLNKAESAVESLYWINPCIALNAVPEAITPSNALNLLAGSDIIVDCTDRPLTRYLLSDASVLLDKPLVSGAAISSSGQWCVYGGTTKEGKRRACYRCMWPAVIGDGGGKCSEVGVWGPVTGMVGSAMAAEVLRLVIGLEDPTPMIHLMQFGSTPFMRDIKLRAPSVKCISCGPSQTISTLDSYDYDEFCSGPAHNDGSAISPSIERLDPRELKTMLDDPNQSRKLTIIDTRPSVEFEICSLPSSMNIPMSAILGHSDSIDIPSSPHIVFVCRQGVDSAIAADLLQRKTAASVKTLLEGEAGEKSLHSKTRFSDVKGGLRAWSKEVDLDFPIY